MASHFQQEPDFSLDFGSAIPPGLASRWKWVFPVLGLVILVLLLNILRGIYTDWLWFGELGFRGVFIKVLVTRVVLFFAGALVFAAGAAVSMYVAHKLSQGPEEVILPPATRDFLRNAIRWGAVAAAAVLSVVFGVLAASQWEVFLKYINGVSFGTVEPVFNKDASFYVFALPLLEFVQSWLLGAAIVIGLASAALYFVNFSFRGARFELTRGLRVQFSIIAAALLFIMAFGHWLDRWGLLLSDQGAVFGAAYADVNARSPALLIVTVVAVAAGIIALANAYVRGIRLLVGGLILWVAMLFLVATIWPNTIQRLTVRPNEFVREQPYIARNIEFTRKAFGLDKVADEPYPVNPTVTSDLIAGNLSTIDNIRLWDRRPLSSVYRFEQIIRPYYDFGEADVDRYEIGGNKRQVMLAAREVAPEKLPSESQSWINQKLRYTHGFGVAMSPVTEFTPKGRPEYFARDIPSDGVIKVEALAPTDGPEIAIENPRIYYGERTTDYVIVNSKTDELDYQAQDQPSPNSINYFGEGGVPIGSFINRVAYAVQFGELNILISGEITGSSRIQYRRQIQDRISAVAPFLRLDHDPYIVATDSGLFWIQDAYTASDRYPYSEPDEEGFNYIRNSVKVVLDAFNGELKFYVWDSNDPLIRTYRRIFPQLFAKEPMPDSLRDHVRYPQDLFSFQASKYLKYHMTIPQDFYNREDIWSLPNEKFGQTADLQPVEPYYVIMKIPGEEREEFVLLLPYTRNEPNPIMAGWLAARNDDENYGKLVAFNFPKERQVKGPEVIESNIDTDPDISEWFTLRCQEGSFCIRGNLLVIPLAVGDEFGLLYAEPIYLQAEGVAFPELKKVILATDEKVVMEDSVDEAVLRLTGFSRGLPVASADEPAPATPATPAPTDAVGQGVKALEDALNGLRDSISAIDDALQGLKKLVGE